jgi:hypothetical protein
MGNRPETLAVSHRADQAGQDRRQLQAAGIESRHSHGQSYTGTTLMSAPMPIPKPGSGLGIGKKDHVYIKYNLATNRVTVIRYNAKGNKELLTKTGKWIPWSNQAEVLDGQTEIYDVYRYDPGEQLTK